MIREILEMLNNEINEDVISKKTIKFKEIFGDKYKDLEAIKQRFNLSNLVTDENLIDAIEFALSDFLNSLIEEIEIAIPQDIIITHNTIILDDWIDYDEEGNEFIPAEDDIEATLEILKGLKLDIITTNGEDIVVEISY